MTRLAPMIINGRYELHRRLGRGGMAEVYLGRDQQLDRAVAVKVLFPALATDPSFAERFRRVAEPAAGLDHPNIVRVHDGGEANGTYFIVMEHVEGESLAELIAREKRLPAARAAEIAADIASALAFAQRNGGVIHRDVKPANVLITRDGGVKVADFGIARAISDAPAQAPQGAEADPRSDVYSLGCVLYEMITGRPPFPGEDAVAIAYEPVHEAPVAPRRIDPAIPETLEAIVLKTLAKNPANRYPSAQDMRSDLRRYLEGARIAAGPGRTPPVGPVDPDATAVMAAVPVGDMDATVEERSPARPPGRSASALRAVGDGDDGHADYDSDYDDDGNEGPLRSHAVLAVLVVLLLVMVGLLLLVTRGGGEEGSGDDAAGAAADVIVPRVVDMPQADAEAALDQAGLTARIETAADATAAAGIVIDQNPAANETVAEGAEITITVSLGPATNPIPDLAGKTQDEAMQALTDLGFVPSPTQVESTTVAEGLVVGTNPPAGTAATAGATVEIQVSGGSNTAAVPDVTNQPEAQARAALEGAGFTVAATPQPNDTVAPGTVLGTNPGPGTMAAKGSTVTMFVSVSSSQVGVVPDVMGRDEDEARRALENAGYQVTTTDQPTDRRRRDGRVLAQNPTGGTPSPPGTVVTIVVGRSQGGD